MQQPQQHHLLSMLRRNTVDRFEEGQKVSVMKQGAEVEMIVFRQSGGLVSLFDRSNRFYLFQVKDVRPIKGYQSDISVCEPSRDAAVHEHR
jgi:hypothetical protein